MDTAEEWDDNQKILRLVLDACLETHKNDAFSGCERLANLFRHGKHSVLWPPSRSDNDARRASTTALAAYGMPKGEGDAVLVEQVVYLLSKFRWDGTMIGKITRLICEHFDRTGVSEARALELVRETLKAELDGHHALLRIADMLRRLGWDVRMPEEPATMPTFPPGHRTPVPVGMAGVIDLLNRWAWNQELARVLHITVNAMYEKEPDEPTAFTADPVERVVQDNLNKEAWEKARALDAIAAKLKDAEEFSVDHLFEIIDTLDEMGYSVSHEKPASIRKFMDTHWSASAQVGHLLEFIDDEGLSGDLRDSLEKILAVGKIVEAAGNKENA